MESSLSSLFGFVLDFASQGAATIVDPGDTLLFFATRLALLAPLGFLLSYVIFQIPMIIGDGLTRNIPILGIMFYRHLAFLVILFASYALATGFTDLFGEFLPFTIANSTLTLAFIGILALILTMTSYKKLENLLSATFYWRRSFGLLDLICLLSSGWIMFKIMQTTTQWPAV